MSVDRVVEAAPTIELLVVEQSRESRTMILSASPPELDGAHPLSARGTNSAQAARTYDLSTTADYGESGLV
jgi:hypothetical protein